MFRPKKTPEESVQPSNRLKLPLESGIRSLSGIKELLTMAEVQRGCQVELPWTTDKAGQTFVLDVQWDANLADPIWSLYEENNGQSTRLWSEAFALADIEILYDVLVMSSGAASAASSKNLAEIFKIQATASKEDLSRVDKKSSEGVKKDESSKDKESNKHDQSATQTKDIAIQKQATPVEQNVPAQPQPQPTLPYPMQAGPVMPGVVYPMPGFVGPGMPAGNFPGYPPMVLPENVGQAMVGPASPAGWQFGQQVNTGPNPALFNQPANPSINQPTQPAQLGSPTNKGAGEIWSNIPIDASLLNKQNDVSLIDLLIKADLVTETLIEAALKIQDLVQEDKLNVDQAAEILKLHHTKGEAIIDYIDPALLAVPIKGKAMTQSTTVSKSNVPKVDTTSGATKKSADKEMSAAFDLLEKAGILTKEDIKTAENVKKKHGGDLVSILRAALKLDAKTMDAALTCVQLEKEGKMKLEQCVIALNYCSRSRVSFDEALDELHWENPKYLKKK